MQRSKVVVKGGVRAHRGPSGWAVGVLGLSMVTGLGVRIAYSQDTPPAANAQLSDTWQGDTLDPKWNVTLLGDAQEYASESHVKVEDGKLRVRVQSGDIWNDNDNGIFIWQPANGDFQITLELRSVEKSSEAAKVGIMVRDSLNRFGPNVFQMAMPKGHHMQARTETGVVAGPGSGCSGVNCIEWGDNSGDISTMPVVLKRLTRTGNLFKADISEDGGKTWIAQHEEDELFKDEAEVEMPDDVLVGIALTSNVAGSPSEAIVGPITFTQTAARPTGKGLVAVTATDDGGTPVADVALEVLKAADLLGSSYNADFEYRSNTASFFLDPGAYTVRTAEDDWYEAGAPVPFEITAGKVEVLKIKVGAEK